MRHRLEHIVKLVGLLSLVFFSTPVTSLASNNCSPIGYTILTLNGIFTNESDAIKNKNDLKDYLDEGHNSEPISIDYLHNPTHLDGWGDILEVYVQKVFDNRAVNLHDLDRMLYDASQKVRTQKVLLVAHSQGNFYANGFYDKVAGKEGGVPRESIGVYGIASPSSRVAGNGRWLTSDTDRVIAGLVARLPGDIMPPNTSIELTNASDKQGHDFANIYLKYEGTRIVNEIYASLDDLESNGVQTTESQCINTPKLTVAHKALDVVYAVADPLAGVAGKVVTTTTDGVKATGEGIAVAADYTSKGLKATGQVMGSGLAMVVNGVSGVLRAGGEFAGSGLAMVYNNIFDSQPAVKYAVSYTPASADEIVFVTGRVANTGMEETQRSVPVARVVESRPTATIDTASIYAALSQIASLQSQVLALRATEVEERERNMRENELRWIEARSQALDDLADLARVKKPDANAYQPGFGGGGGPSIVASVTSVSANTQNTPTVPSAPESLIAVPGDQTVLLSWTAPVDNGGEEVTDYLVYQSIDNFAMDNSLLDDGESTDADLLIAGLLNGTEYYFKIAALNSVGKSVDSNIVSVTPATVPDAPIMHDGLEPDSSDGINNFITFSWDAPTSDGGSEVTSYIFEYSSTTDFSLLDLSFTTSTADDTDYRTIVEAFAPYVPYNFRVFAINLIGTSEASATVTMTPGVPPPPPIFF